MTAEEWAGLCDQNVHLTGWGTRLRPYRYGWTESSGNNIDTGENSTTTANAAAATAAATAARKLLIEREFFALQEGHRGGVPADRRTHPQV